MPHRIDGMTGIVIIARLDVDVGSICRGSRDARRLGHFVIGGRSGSFRHSRACGPGRRVGGGGGAAAGPSQKGLSSFVFGAAAGHFGLVESSRREVLRTGEDFVGVLDVVEFFGDGGDFGFGEVGGEFVGVELEHGGAVGFFDLGFAGGGGQVQDCERGEGGVASFVEKGGHVGVVGGVVSVSRGMVPFCTEQSRGGLSNEDDSPMALMQSKIDVGGADDGAA